MLVMVVFFIAFRWIHLSTPLIRVFLLVLILLLMPTLNFLPVWFALSLFVFVRLSRVWRALIVLPVWLALSLVPFRLHSRLPRVCIRWMVALMVVIMASRAV